MQTEKSKFSKIFDFILGRVIIFTLAFIWCRYFVSKLNLSLILAALIMLGFIAVFDLIFKRPQKVWSDMQKQIDKLTDILLYCDKNEIINQLAKTISKKHNAQVKDGCIILSGENQTQENNTIIYPFFSPVKLTASDSRGILDKLLPQKPRKIIVLTCGYLPTAADFTDRIKSPKIILFDQQDLQNILNNYQATLDLEPDIEKEKNKKPQLKQLLALATSRDKIKGYLFASFVMVTGSFFVAFSLYYRIFATLFLMMALFCLRNQKKKEDTEKDFA